MVAVETLERGDGVTFPMTGERVDVTYTAMTVAGKVVDRCVRSHL